MDQDVSRTPRQRAGITLGLAMFTVGGAGCCAIPDPSASVCNEMSNVGCRNFLYHPDVCLTGINETNWYACPLQWRPACPPLGGELHSWKALPPSKAIFALPEADFTPSPLPANPDNQLPPLP